MQTPAGRLYGSLVKEAARRDIGRSTAFELARTDLLETFKIGARRYVYLDSLDTLPQRLKEREQQEAA
jgi:hypothetical protein